MDAVSCAATHRELLLVNFEYGFCSLELEVLRNSTIESLQQLKLETTKWLEANGFAIIFVANQ